MPSGPRYRVALAKEWLWGLVYTEGGVGLHCCTDCGDNCDAFAWPSYFSFSQLSASWFSFSGFSTDPVRYANGEVKMTASDLGSKGLGFPWGHTRSYSNQLTDQAGGANGNSWRVAEWPFLVEESPTSVCVVAGTIYDAVWFNLVNGQYVPQFGALASLRYDAPQGQYVYADEKGYQWKFFDYGAGVPEKLRGQFKSFTDLGGRETVPSYDPQTNLLSAFVREDKEFSVGYHYAYYTEGDNAGLLQYVTLVVNGQEVQRGHYTYYGAKEKFGNLNDLKFATVQEKKGKAWADLRQAYYRYYKPGEAEGIAHGLRYTLGPQTLARMREEGQDPETATNLEIAKQANNAFKYDPVTQAVTQEKTLGGKIKFEFRRTASEFAEGFNNWAVKTVERLPDGNENIVFTNFAGQPMLSVRKAGDKEWYTAVRYDEKGNPLQVAHSSAVEGFNEQRADVAILKPGAGLVDRFDYYAETNPAAGAAAGFLRSKQVQLGSEGAPILVNEYHYTARTALGQTIHPLWKETCYPDAKDPLLQLQCKIYQYTWQGATLQVEQKTTILPVVPTSQNGSGQADSKKEVVDSYGYLTWLMDERGFLTQQTYDIATGGVVQRIQDVDTKVVSGAPAGWVTPPGGGLNLVTDYTVDLLGRTTQELGPLHDVDLNGESTALRRAQWTAYKDAQHEVLRASGYAVPAGASYDFTLVNPVSLTKSDHNNRPTNQVQAVRADTHGPLTEADHFPQSTWVGWRWTTYAGGSNPSREAVYFLIPEEGLGVRLVNYNQSRYAYNSMQQLVREQTPAGTITRLVLNPMGWVLQRWMGTNDNGATDSDPTGKGQPYRMGNNMVLVEENEYDHGHAGGDGNLTKKTLFADESVQRVTAYQYDFRDRQTVVDGELDQCQVTTYNNLDKIIQTDQYDTSPSGKLVARAATRYDSRGNVYQTLKYGVDPATGQLGPALVSNTWYDPSGAAIQSNAAGSALLQKSVRDGAGRMVAQYSGLGATAAYPYPVNVSQDTVFQQSETVYDRASNVIQQTARERFHDATGLGTLQGPNGAQPRARVSYDAQWPDALGRRHLAGNYGTNQGAPFARPATAPARSDTVLMTTTEYNEAGRAYQVTDPLGRRKRSAFDAAGRLTQLWENYVPGGTASDQNRETEYTYNADGKIATLTAKNSVTGDQVTRYLYGTTLENSSLADHGLLRAILYPDDSPTTADRVTMAYNRLGQEVKRTDQMGTVRELAYDLLGRPVSDAVTTLGGGVDGAVRRIGRAYEVRGMLAVITSYDAAEGGAVVNEARMEYNAFAQLAAQYQSHDGAAGPGAPAVRYGYADGSANTIRATTLTYSDGRETRFDYGSSGQSDDLLSRISALVDDDGSTPLAAYTYVGLNRVAQVSSPQPGFKLTYLQQGPGNPPVGSGGDQYTGWDQFGRVVDQRWINNGGVDLERCTFGFNAGSNRLWRKNVVAQTGQDGLYAYDGLSQLKDFKRGTLDPSHTGLIGTPAWQEDFKFDPTGNWDKYVNRTHGQLTLDQPRTHNPVNEIETIGGSGSLISQDATGNMDKAPKPADWNSAFTMKYDAWNRLTQVKAGSKVIAHYAYNGFKWRVSKTAGGETRKYFYTNDWQMLEERVDDAATPDRQFVWGLLGKDNLVLRDRPGLNERRYPLSDYVSVTAITDATGAVRERYAYNAYGTPLFLDANFAPASGSASEWETLYDSYRCDPETGYYQVRNRYLHPTLGRWISRDPVGYEDGVNLYAYCGNDSVNRTDTSGTISLKLDIHTYQCFMECIITDETGSTTYRDSIKGITVNHVCVNHSFCCSGANSVYCLALGNGTPRVIAISLAFASFNTCLNFVP